MARSNPTHYIAPSAISLTPNCNGSANDIAVYIARDTTIKVYSPKAGINTVNGSFQEWKLTGRNRRLADSTKPYTIYARLSKTDKSIGYLVFAAKTTYGDPWEDKYPYVTPDGIADIEGVFIDDGNWYIRLGEVSLPENSLRTITLDTGILDTDDFNANWALNPDALPLRIELGATIDDEDAGPTPYVYWGQSLVLTASLVEGWTGTQIDRFDHWEITRNTGDAPADAAWNETMEEDEFKDTGTITLSHARGTGDDFNGAVATTFTITAWGIPDEADSSDISSSSSGDKSMVPLVTASINIMAETVEKYELALSTNIASYNPQDGTYSPADGIDVTVRATDQRGELFDVTFGQFDNTGLSVLYAPVDSDDWTELPFSGTATDIATANLPISAFAEQKNLNVRLMRLISSDSSSSSSGSAETTEKELFRTTIAFVRDGEDSKEREWIFLPSATALTFGDGTGGTTVKPSLISGGQVNPTSAATGNDPEKDQDGWVPEGWYDNPQGTDETTQFEYASYRDFVHNSDINRSSSDDSSSSEDGGIGYWGEFSEPRIWTHYGHDAVRLDISNEMDMVQTTSTGMVEKEREVVTNVHLYSGASAQPIGNPTISVTYKDANGNKQTASGIVYKDANGNTKTLSPTITPTANSVEKTLSWAFTTGMTLFETYDVTISHAYNGTTYSAVFTIAASMGLPVYQLSPSYAALPCTRNDATNTLGNPPALALNVVRIDGNTTASLSTYSAAGQMTDNGQTLYIRYSLTSMPTSRTAGTAWPTANSVQAASTNDNVYIALFNANGVLLDRETVPIVKDGANGDGIVSVTRTYAISKDSTSASDTTAPGNLGTAWLASSPAVNETYPYLWAKEVVDYKYQADTTKYYCIGARGQNGIDAQDIEWVFVRTKTSTAPTISASTASGGGNAPYGGKSYTDDDFLPLSSAGRCTDDPQGVDETWQYEWEIKREKGTADSNGHRSWPVYSGTMTLHNNWAANAIRLDLTNQTDLVSLDSDGKVRFDRTVETKARIYDGGTIATTNVALTDTEANIKAALRYGTASTGCTPTVSLSGGILTVTWAFKKGMVIPVGTKTLSLNYTKGTTTTEYSAAFSLGSTDADAIYQVLPSPSEVTFTRNATTNALEPASVSLTCGYTKSTGSGTEVTAAASGYSIDSGACYLYYRVKTASGWAAWQKYTGSITVGNGETNTDYEFGLSTASSSPTDTDIFDREVVPVMKDGANGDGIVSVTRTYAISKDSTSASDTTAPGNLGTAWLASSPAVNETYPYLWAKEVVDYKYQADTTKYYCIGARGDNGIDAQDIEWVYVRTEKNVAPTIYYNGTDSYNVDDFLPLAKVSNGKIKGGTEAAANTAVRCTDDPQGVSETWPYEWEIKREKGTSDSNGHRTWDNYPNGKAMTLHNNYASSNLVLDLDNENDQFGTDSTGEVLEQQTRSTGVTMYYGKDEQTITAMEVTLYNADTNAKVTDTAKATVIKSINADGTGTVTVVIKTQTGAPSGYYAEIEATCENGTNTARFSLAKLMSGAKGDSPVIYQLNPDMKSITFGRDASNNLTPTSRTVTVNVLHTIGNDTTEKTSVITGITWSWGFTKADGTTTTEATGKAVGTALSVSNSDAANYTHVWLKLSTGDTETLPIVKDGANGAKGNDGAPVPQYTQTQEAWSNAVSVSSITTEPTPNGGWSDSTPANTNSYAYLWRRSRLMTYDSTTKAYTAGAWYYVRLSGTNGTSISVKGTVATTSDLAGISSPSDGDAYVCEADGHLYMWSGEASDWIDIGQFKGDTGDTYYTHIAWAKTVTFGTSTATRTTGQTTTPNASNVGDFSISPADGYDYMGVLVDREATDPGSAYKLCYTWKYVKGESGENAVRLALDNEHEDFLYNDDGTLISPSGGATSSICLYDGSSAMTSNATLTIYNASGTSATTDTTVAARTYISGTTLYVKGISAETAEVTVRAEYPQSSGKYYYAKFTANKIKQDKYDLVVKPSSIAYNPASYTAQTVALSAIRIDLQGNVTKDVSISTTADSGHLRIFFGLVRNNGNVVNPTGGSTLYNLASTSMSITASHCANYAGIYFELRYYNSATALDSSTDYRICDYETVEIAKAENGENAVKGTETYKYQVSTSGTTTPTGTWQSTKQSAIDAYVNDGTTGNDWPKGTYMWTQTTIPWTSATSGTSLGSTVLYSSERNPNDGEPGQDIIVDGSTTMTYCVSNTNTAQPYDRSFKAYALAIADIDDTHRWLWSKATTYYRKADSAAGAHDAGSSSNYTVTYIPTDGSAGRAVTGSEEYYKATNSSTSYSAKVSSDTGWVTNPNSAGWGSSSIYLWNYEKVEYTESDGTKTYDRTIPRVIAIWTKDGRGIDSIVNYYAINNSATTAPTSGWDDDPMAPTEENPYLWNYERIYWTVADSEGNMYKDTDPHVIGHYGADGESPWVADLDNEMDAISCDDLGKAVGAQTVSTKVRLLEGNTAKSFTMTVKKNGTTMVSGNDLDGTTATWSASTGVLSIAYADKTEISTKDVYTITLANAAERVSRNLTFKVNAIVGDVFNLLTTVSEVVMEVDSNNAYTDNRTLYAGYSQRNGNSITEYPGTDKANTWTGGTAPYNIFYRLLQNGTPLDTSTDNPGGWSWMKDSNSGGTYAGLLVSASSTATHVELLLTDATSVLRTATKSLYYDGSYNVIDRETIPIVHGGKTGAAGHVGRFYYYAGVWSSSTTYTMAETQAPYVQYNGKFYMLDNGGTEPSSLPMSVKSSTNPSSDSRWTEMASEQQYYIAKAFFGEYAQFGAFIINGDWMFSQYGILYQTAGTGTTIGSSNYATSYTINSVTGVPYTFFKASSPQGTAKGTFAPSFAVDGKTGQVYMNNAYVKGTVYATAVYQTWQSVGSKSETLDPSKGSAFDVGRYLATDGPIILTLPNASDYSYITLTLLCRVELTTRLPMAPPIIKGSILAKTGTYNESTSKTDYTYSNFLLKENRLTKLHSFGTIWVLDTDETDMQFDVSES